MSSSNRSPSPSRSQRTPLHERSNSETNKLGIRLVPYSPPRLARESIGSASQGPTTEPGFDVSNQFSDDATSTKGKKSTDRDEPYAIHPGAGLASPALSATSWTRAKDRGVSGPDSSGVGPSTPPPAHNWSSYGSQRSDVNAGYEIGLGSPSKKAAYSSRSRRDKHIAVHPDKTFSVVLKPTGHSLRLSDRTATDSSIRSPPVSTYSTVSSHEAFSFEAPDEDRPSSALSSLPDRSVSPGTPGSGIPAEAAEDQSPSSWNYRVAGNVRKAHNIPENPDRKGKEKDVFVSGPSSPLPTLREVSSSPEPEPEPELPSQLDTKPSFTSQTSGGTAVTLEETTNYKVFGRSSPPPPDNASSPSPSTNSESNYEVLAESSPAPSLAPSLPRFPTPPPRISSRNFSIRSSSPTVVHTPASKNLTVHSYSPAEIPSTPTSSDFQVGSSPAHGDLLDTPGSRNFIVHPSPPPEALNTPGSNNYVVHSSPVPEALNTPGSKNYVVHSSPAPEALNTPGSKNYVVHSSPAPEALNTPGSKNYVVYPSSPPEPLDTPGSQNFIVHPGTSPAPSGQDLSRPGSSRPVTGHGPRHQYSDDALTLRGKYSQESLVVRPLNTVSRKSSEDRLGYYKQRSREHLRRASSFSSLSSIISQEPSILLANAVNIVPLTRAQLASTFAQPSWATRPRMDAHPHQWSSQLSTVVSEDEGSEQGSRQLSISSGPGQRSPSYASRDSRQLMSMSSSMMGEELSSSDSYRPRSRSHSRTGSGPFMMRGARDLPNPPRMVRDVDEHGDGLTDLHELHHKGSRTRLGQFLSHKASDISLRSTSSRAGSITSANIPVWARIYYGSGERKWLHAAPSIRSFSDDSRPASSLGPSGSPALEQFPPNIFTPRRRPREVIPEMEDRPISNEAVPMRLSTGPNMRRITSSVWSPHLQTDRRASRMSIWQPPSVTWSADTSFFGKRNMQILLFAFGFIFPFAWMVAAFLPLPQRYVVDMEERDHSTTQFSIPESPDLLGRQAQVVADSRYHSARWWRNVNRFMSVIGLLVIGAIIALAIVGFWQNMARR